MPRLRARYDGSQQVRRGALTLLTGPPGSGKTTLCREFVATAVAAGRDVAGVLSPAAFTNGHKLGIDAVDLRTGETRPLASRPAAAQAGESHPGPWHFDETTLAWGDALLRSATPCGLLVVDELGPLEWREGRGWLAGLDAVDSGDYDHALVVVRPGLIPAATARWPRGRVLRATDADARQRLLASVQREP